MNQTILEEARAALAGGPVPLTELLERLKLAGSAWSESQHCLFFLAFDGFSVDRTGDQTMVCSGERSPKDRLLSDIVQAVESFSGKSVPAREIRKRLPADYVTTDEQVKAVAKISEKLHVYGPGLIRKK
jgi:hypothetical protein